jgi:integrase
VTAHISSPRAMAMYTPKNPVPPRIRVYDFRHRFASACLYRWLDNGDNLLSKLPYLCTFMGHKSYNETAEYIHLLPENLIKSPGVKWEAFENMFPDIGVNYKGDLEDSRNEE